MRIHPEESDQENKESLHYKFHLDKEFMRFFLKKRLQREEVFKHQITEGLL